MEIIKFFFDDFVHFLEMVFLLLLFKGTFTNLIRKTKEFALVVKEKYKEKLNENSDN